MTFQQFLLILRARLWVVFGTLVVVVGTALAGFLLPKQYTAETALVVDAKVGRPAHGRHAARADDPRLHGHPGGHHQLHARRPAGGRPAQDGSVAGHPGAMARNNEGQGSIKIWLAELLMKKLDVQPSRESSMLTIGYQGADPQFAAAVANAWAQAYIDTSLELKVEPARQYAKWFDGQNATLRADLEAAQKRLSDYQQSRASSPPTTGSTENARLAEPLDPALGGSGAEGGQPARARRNPATPTTCPRSCQNGLIQSLKADLVRQEGQRDQLAGRLGKNHPRSPAAMPKSPTCAGASPPKRAAW